MANNECGAEQVGGVVPGRTWGRRGDWRAVRAEGRQRDTRGPLNAARDAKEKAEEKKYVEQGKQKAAELVEEGKRQAKESVDKGREYYEKGRTHGPSTWKRARA